MYHYSKDIAAYNSDNAIPAYPLYLSILCSDRYLVYNRISKTYVASSSGSEYVVDSLEVIEVVEIVIVSTQLPALRIGCFEGWKERLNQ